MKKHLKYFCFVVLSIIISFSSGSRLFSQIHTTDELKKNLDDLYTSAELDNSFLGIYIENLNIGEIVYRQNENNFFMPASNMKLFTTAAALVLLEPDFTYKTGIYYHGKIENGILKGDLYIRGSGDPTISGRFTDENMNKKFSDVAKKIKEAGIKVIEGNIIGDDNYFDDVLYGYGWSWDDFPYWYAAQLSALSFNDNCIDFTITPADSITKPAIVAWRPKTGYINFENNVTTSIPGRFRNIFFWRDLSTNKITADGFIQFDGEPYNESISVFNPTLFTTMAFKNVLDSLNIEIKGKAFDIDDIKKQPSKEQEYIFYNKECKKITEIESPPLSEIIKVVNKKSHNFYADMLLKTLGKEFRGQGSIQSGRNVVEKFLSKIGIDPVNFFMYDGSGLSRTNLVKPIQIAKLLKYMRRHKYFEIYYKSLPIAGIDGTLEERMLNTNCVGKVRAKTGTIRFVRALSGYVNAKEDNFIFVIIGNHFRFPYSIIEYVQDKTCEFLVNFKNEKVINDNKKEK